MQTIKTIESTGTVVRHVISLTSQTEHKYYEVTKCQVFQWLTRGYGIKYSRKILSLISAELHVVATFYSFFCFSLSCEHSRVGV